MKTVQQCAEVTAECEVVATVPINRLRITDSPRGEGIREEHAKLLFDSGAELPAILVHRETMRVIDGAHRLRAAQLAGAETIKVRFFEGSVEDAFVLAVKANVSHGLPLSTADRKRAAERILRTHSHWSNRAVATSVGLAATTIAALRRRVGGNVVPLTNRVGRDGRIRPVDGSVGRRRARDMLAVKPNATLREISAAAGISPNTARDVRDRLRRGEDPLPPTQRRREASRGTRPVHRDLRAVRRDEPSVSAGASLAATVRMLRNDPSLRLTENGRVLLRFFDSHLVVAENRGELLDTVPAHWSDVVADLALECARTWGEFAARLRSRPVESA